MPNEVEGDLQINPFIPMATHLSNDIDTSPNKIGTSDLHYCPRKTVIKKLYDIHEPLNMRMLFGTIIHKLVEYKPVRTEIVDYINKKLGIKGNPLSIVEKEKELEVLPGYFFRFHSDIASPHYIVETKTTARPQRQWTKDVAIQHTLQLNDYVCKFKKEFGILLMINQYAFLSGSKNWDYIVKNFTYTLKFEPDYKQYQNDLELVKILFEHVIEGTFEKLNGPCYSWECNSCYHEIMKKCGKELYKCQARKVNGDKCYKKMVEYPHELTGKFTDNPLCELCFYDQFPKNKYLKYKYTNYKQKEEELMKNKV